MTPKPLGALALASLVILAGCAGFAPTGTGNSPTDGSAPTVDGNGATPGDGVHSATAGVVQFYVSDERNAIGDFEHLNVTIERVGFQRAGDADEEDDEEGSENETETDVNATTTETTAVNDTMTATSTVTANATRTATATATSTANATTTDTVSVTATAEEPEETEADTEETEDEEDEDETGEDGDDEREESGDWIEYEVENRTVDLTRLQGENATLLSAFDVPEGTYTTVFVHVSDVDATLENGEETNVKLPSGKLQITKGFTVEENESVDFVFDITVHKAGKSGKYILTPVVSESGTDVPIEDVDDERDEERDDDSEKTLNASFAGPVEPGRNVTVRVTQNGSGIENATVRLNDEVVGTTDDAGELTVAVPADAEEVEVTVESGHGEAELEAEFESEEESGDEAAEEGRENGDSNRGGNGKGR